MKKTKFLFLLTLLAFPLVNYSQESITKTSNFIIPITSKDQLFKKEGLIATSEILEIINSSYIDFVKSEKYTNESRQFSKVYILAKNENNKNYNLIILKRPYNITSYACYLISVSKDYSKLLSLTEIVNVGEPSSKILFFNGQENFIVNEEVEGNGTKYQYIIRPDGYFELTSFENYEVF